RSVPVAAVVPFAETGVSSSLFAYFLVVSKFEIVSVVSVGSVAIVVAWVSPVDESKVPLTPVVTEQALTLIVVAVMYEFAVAVQVTTLAPSVKRIESPDLRFPRSAVTVYVAVPIVVFAPIVG